MTFRKSCSKNDYYRLTIDYKHIKPYDNFFGN